MSRSGHLGWIWLLVATNTGVSAAGMTSRASLFLQLAAPSVGTKMARAEQQALPITTCSNSQLLRVDLMSWVTSQWTDIARHDRVEFAHERC